VIASKKTIWFSKLHPSQHQMKSPAAAAVVAADTHPHQTTPTTAPPLLLLLLLCHEPVLPLPQHQPLQYLPVGLGLGEVLDVGAADAARQCGALLGHPAHPGDEVLRNLGGWVGGWVDGWVDGSGGGWEWGGGGGG